MAEGILSFVWSVVLCECGISCSQLAYCVTGTVFSASVFRCNAATGVCLLFLLLFSVYTLFDGICTLCIYVPFSVSRSLRSNKCCLV